VTALLWAAIGVTIGAAVLHAALGMWRPPDRAYLSFAAMLAFLAAYFYFRLDLYQAITADETVEAARRQVLAVLACHGCLLVFVPAYTRVRIPQPVLAVYWGGLAILLVASFWAPYGLWFSGPPELVHKASDGEPYDTIVAPPMLLPQHVYALYFASVLILGLVCALGLFRSGERQRSVTLAAALVLVLASNLVDVIRDSVGGSWPYVAELGFVSWAFIMPVQLARDFRVQAEALGTAIAQVETQGERSRSMLDALRALEQNIHVPLETLEAGVAALTAATAKDHDRLQRLRRAVTRLREVARSMPDVRAARRGTSLPE